MASDDIPSFIIKGCSQIFVPLLMYIFNISLISQIFHFLCKGSVVIPLYKEGSNFVVIYSISLIYIYMCVCVCVCV